MTAQRVRFSTRRSGDERGATLVMVLALVIVVSVAGTAVLEQQASAPQVRKTYTDLRTDTSAVDRIAEAAVAALRFDRLAGLSPEIGSSGPCSADLSELKTAAGTAIHKENAGSYRVFCEPDPDSGRLMGEAGDVPPNTILALGGQARRGNVRAANGTQPSGPVILAEGANGTQSVVTNQNPAFRYPFCDDWQPPGDGLRCETGFFVAKATSTTTAEGLAIAPNGGLTTDQVLLRSNSGVIVNTNGDANRRLRVFGGIQARRACGGYNPAVATSFIASPEWGTSTNIEYPTGVTPDCANVAGPFTGSKWEADSLIPDPLYVHAPIDLSRKCPVPAGHTACVPRVNNHPDTEAKFRLPLSLCADGYVEMPAQQVGTQDGQPVYAAWYDSVAAINDLMFNCRDTLFYFRPGVYYFDFLETSGSTKWEGFFGCFPNTSACPASAMVGGTPQGWTPPRDPTQHAEQKNKVMITNKNQASTAAYWHDAQETSDLDGVSGTNLMYDAGDHKAASLTQRDLQTPLPQSAGTYDPTYEIKVRFEIAYDMPSGGPSNYSQYYDFIPISGGYTSPAGRALVEFSLGDGDKCYVSFPAGTHSELRDGPDPARVPNALDPNYDPAQTFDLSNGCVNGPSPGGPRPQVVAATGFFSGPWTGWTPARVNGLKATFTARGGSTTTSTNPGALYVDGMQFVVDYKGRPSPPFPEGCDDTEPGVQFIFGNTARLGWGDGNRNGFAELCASRTDRFPNWIGDAPAGITGSRCAEGSDANSPCNMTGPGHNLNIAIYGANNYSPSDPVDPFDRTNAFDPYDVRGSGSIYTKSSASVPLAPDATATCDGTGTKLCTRTTSAAPTSDAFLGAKPSAYAKVDGGAPTAAQRTTALWTTTGAQQLVFRLPNLVCRTTDWPNCGDKPIAQGSRITNVQFRFRHREGRWTGSADGTTCPTTPVDSCFIPAGSATGRQISQVAVSINAGVSAVGSNGSSGQSWGWSTAADKTGLNNGYGIPISSVANGCADEFGYCNYVYGDPRGPGYSTDPDARWYLQRDLTDKLSTPEAVGGYSPAYGSIMSLTGDSVNDLAGAEVGISFTTTGSGLPAGTYHRADIDGFELVVSWRPPGEIRPLAGCLTTRSKWAPGYLLEPDPADPSGVKAAPGYTWLDEDWGDKDSDLEIDAPHVNAGSGGTAGNGNSEQAACALISLNNSAPNIKFHVQGTIYAPSAPLHLTGDDNDASWVTDGIIARQITAWKWRRGNGWPAVGGSSPPRENRKVTIEVRDSTGTEVLLRRVVEFDDNNFETTTTGKSAIGRGVTVVSNIRRPES